MKLTLEEAVRLQKFEGMGFTFQELLEGARANSRNAWKALYQRYAPHILGFARCQHPQDPHALLRGVISEFVESIEDVPGKDAQFRTWLFVSAQKQLLAMPKQTAPSEPDTSPVISESEQRMYDLLAVLPNNQRAIIYMRYAAQLPNDQIATVLGLSVDTVQNMQVLGLDSLKRRMTQTNETISAFARNVRISVDEFTQTDVDSMVALRSRNFEPVPMRERQAVPIQQRTVAGSARKAYQRFAAIALAMVTLVFGTGGMAFAGLLPASLQRAASHAARSAGITIPTPKAAENSNEKSVASSSETGSKANPASSNSNAANAQDPDNDAPGAKSPVDNNAPNPPASSDTPTSDDADNGAPSNPGNSGGSKPDNPPAPPSNPGNGNDNPGSDKPNNPPPPPTPPPANPGNGNDNPSNSNGGGNGNNGGGNGNGNNGNGGKK